MIVSSDFGVNASKVDGVDFYSVAAVDGLNKNSKIELWKITG